jgi:hypothetical protein
VGEGLHHAQVEAETSDLADRRAFHGLVRGPPIAELVGNAQLEDEANPGPPLVMSRRR